MGNHRGACCWARPNRARKEFAPFFTHSNNARAYLLPRSHYLFDTRTRIPLVQTRKIEQEKPLQVSGAGGDCNLLRRVLCAARNVPRPPRLLQILHEPGAEIFTCIHPLVSRDLVFLSRELSFLQKRPPPFAANPRSRVSADIRSPCVRRVRIRHLSRLISWPSCRFSSSLLWRT